MESCSARAAGACTAMGLGGAWPAIAAEARPRPHARALLTDEHGDPLRCATLRVRTNYLFHYPFEATPVFLLDLGQAAPAQALATRDGQAYAWPGGVGLKRSIVAFSAICAHQLVYPTKDVSFISFRKTRATRGQADNLIHCCADHSQYDPARGAAVLSGPAPQPLCAVLLEYESKSDTLVAYGTLGGELFEDFFRKYEFKLSLDVGPSARRPVDGRAVVRELEKFCRNTIQC